MGHSRMVWPAVLLTLVAFGGAFAGSPGAGGSYVGDVNVSAILDSFSVSYDKRVRPNYGGKVCLRLQARLWMSESPCMC
uniref:Uncharacterized protein LOC114336949 isoform X4 n=1 Tax=Diabrotica virgifera virgifera TaxID=50390 RepID=A0A6P7GGX6_DIAVI